MSGGSFDVNFTDINSLSSTPFNNVWGDASEHSLSSQGLWLGSSGADYKPMGIMQNPTGASAGEGYGLYSYSARYEYANQPGGDYLLLWRADNQWLDSAAPGLITEMDMLETFDNSSSMASTLHYYQSSAGSGNGYSSHDITGIKLTALNVYSMDWEANSLTFYINGKEIYQITGSSVPKDYAHGGSNQVMGMGAESESSPVGMYVTEAQYTSAADLATGGGAATVMAAQMSRAGLSTSGVSTSNPSAGSTSTGSTSTGAPTSGIIADTATITVSAPGTVQAATAGAAVTVAETITGTANATVYEAVFNSSYSAEENWTAVKLNSAGTATVNATFEHSGDLLIVASNTSGSAPEAGYSSAITITNPVAATIAVSAPGSAQEASLGAGVTVSETIKATGLSTAYAEVLTASGAVETAFQAVSIGSGGTGTVSLHLAKTGDYVEVVNNTTSPTVVAKSAAVSITDPVAAKPTIAVSAPGTMQEASKGAGVTVTETITATGLSTAYAEVLTKSGAVESGYQAVNLTNGTGTVSLHLANSGDVVQVASSLNSPVVTAMSSAISITDPTTTTATPPSGSLFSITSITEVKGELIVVGSRNIGETATVRDVIDGSYKGVIWDNAPDGAFTYTLAAPTTAGTHTLQLTLDGSSVTASMSFITTSSGTTTGIGTVASGPSGGTTTTTTSTSTGGGTSVSSSGSTATAGGLTIGSLTEDAGRLLMTGDKATGGSNTLREYMDGHYLGTVRDGMADGAFSMHIQDVAAGAHVLKLTLDGSSSTATYDFTKQANGSVQALLPTTTSASTLIAANHETTALAA